MELWQVVYVARNPKDVIVSNYHHFKLFKFHDYKGTLEQFAEYSMDGLSIIVFKSSSSRFLLNDFRLMLTVYYSPYFPHVLEAWSQRHHPNVLFLFFEEMKQVIFLNVALIGLELIEFWFNKNLRAVVERVAAHLNQTITEEQMVRVLDHLSFKRLAEGEAAETAKAKEMGVINEGAGTFFRKGKFITTKVN